MLSILFFMGITNVFVYGVSAWKPLSLRMTTDINRVNKDSLPLLSYNKLLQDMDSHTIDRIYFSPKLDTVISEYNFEGVLNDPYLATTKITPFVVDSVAKIATEKKVETVFLVEPPPTWVNNVVAFGTSYLLPFFILSSLFSFMRNAVGGGMPGMPPPGFLQRKQMSKDKLLVTKANITLASFAGSEEIMEECTEVVSYLKNSTLYDLAGAEIPRGILLEGSPGTGKTLLAKAIASEAEANFISVAASEFVEIFVGVGAAKIRELFKTARENKPCIVFIDEIDAVGKQRGGSNLGGNDEREQTLNQLLAEMDGFQDNDQILIMAATNRKDILDAALLRPGRFDRIITVPMPDKSSRQKILESYAQSKKLSEDVRLDLVSEITGGFSGAQLKNLLNEAAILAARRGETVITNDFILAALDKLVVGIERTTDDRDDNAKRRVAIHEAGHAFLAHLFQEYFELKKVTIKSTYNGAGGYTLLKEKSSISESGLYTKDLLMKRLIVAMGGKAAETVFYGEKQVSLGAIQDLKQANSLAQRMIGNYGMGKKLDVFFNEEIGSSYSSGKKYSEKTKEKFDVESLQLVKDAFLEAIQILLENKGKVESMVDLLLKKTTLSGKEVSETI